MLPIISEFNNDWKKDIYLDIGKREGKKEVLNCELDVNLWVFKKYMFDSF